MEAAGPRIVVFRVSGTITLANAIRVRTPCAHDIVPRHLRVAIGGNMKQNAGNNLLFY